MGPLLTGLAAGEGRKRPAPSSWEVEGGEPAMSLSSFQEMKHTAVTRVSVELHVMAFPKMPRNFAKHRTHPPSSKTASK